MSQPRFVLVTRAGRELPVVFYRFLILTRCYADRRMNTADVMLVGLEQVSEPDFARLQACVREWRVLWGLTLTHCLRLEDERDAFVLIAERTYREALDHLEECLRVAFPEQVIVAHAYVQGAHLPVFTMDEAGFELMQRMQRRTAHIVQDARAGKPSPLLPPRRSDQAGVAAWRERNHVIPSGRGTYLLCDACGDSTERQTTEDEAWSFASTKGWRLYREWNVCFCERCVQNGNAQVLERLLFKLDTRRSA